jgi:hypothetical protein
MVLTFHWKLVLERNDKTTTKRKKTGEDEPHPPLFFLDGYPSPVVAKD